MTTGMAGAFKELFCATTPQLTRSLQSSLSTGRLREFYDKTAPVDFSQAVLSRLPERLAVLRDARSGWMDLGSPHRVIEALTLSGMQAPWLVSNGNGTHGASQLSVVA